MEELEDYDADNLHLPTNRYLTNKSNQHLVKKTGKNLLLNSTDLNTSSASSTSSSNVNSDCTNTHHLKPQYTLVNNKSSSSSSSSSCNATHHLRPDTLEDDDEFGLLSMGNTMSRKLRDNTLNRGYQIKQQNQSLLIGNNQRYLYSTLATGESLGPNDVNIIVTDSSAKLNRLKLKTNHPSVNGPTTVEIHHPHSSSSAYSSITNSDVTNLDMDTSSGTSPVNGGTTMSLKHKPITKPDPSLVSFKKNMPSNIISNNVNNSFNNSNNNNNNHNVGLRPTLRTSFNL